MTLDSVLTGIVTGVVALITLSERNMRCFIFMSSIHLI